MDDTAVIETPLGTRRQYLQLVGRLSARSVDKHLIDRYQIPDDVVHAAYSDNPTHRQQLKDRVASVRSLCDEVGIITPTLRRLCQLLGIW